MLTIGTMVVLNNQTTKSIGNENSAAQPVESPHLSDKSLQRAEKILEGKNILLLDNKFRAN